MVSAQQDQVAEFGRAAGCPVADVVALAVAWWAMTAREGAAAVAQVQRAAEWSGDQAMVTAEVEGFALGAEDYGDELAVAGVDAGFGGGHGAEVAEHGPADSDLGLSVEGGLTGGYLSCGAGVVEDDRSGSGGKNRNDKHGLADARLQVRQ